MKRLALLAIVAGLLSGAPPSAHAGADSTHRGGCAFSTLQRDLDVNRHGYPEGRHLMTGELDSATVVYSPSSGGNPVSATVRCDITINGEVAVSAEWSGTTVVAGAKRVSFYLNDYDVVGRCDTIDYTSDDTPTERVCPEDTTVQLVPQFVYDSVLVPALDALHDQADELDSTLCPLLAEHAPGVPGLVDINDQGDTRLLGGEAWECAPDAPPTPRPIPVVPPECSDGVDNDLDGLVDYPADTDCLGPDYDAEGLTTPSPPEPPRPCSTVGTVTACVSLTPETLVATYAVADPETALTYPTMYDAQISDYDFTLPNGGTATVRCIVVSGPVVADPCAAAGGTRTGYPSYLFLVAPREPYRTAAEVGVCTADLTVTVNDVGVSSAPAYSLC